MEGSNKIQSRFPLHYFYWKGTHGQTRGWTDLGLFVGGRGALVTPGDSKLHWSSPCTTSSPLTCSRGPFQPELLSNPGGVRNTKQPGDVWGTAKEMTYVRKGTWARGKLKSITHTRHHLSAPLPAPTNSSTLPLHLLQPILCKDGSSSV